MVYSDITYVGMGPGSGSEWVTVCYVKPSHCNLCGNLNGWSGSCTLALYQSQSRSHLSSVWLDHNREIKDCEGGIKTCLSKNARCILPLKRTWAILQVCCVKDLHRWNSIPLISNVTNLVRLCDAYVSVWRPWTAALYPHYRAFPPGSWVSQRYLPVVLWLKFKKSKKSIHLLEDSITHGTLFAKFASTWRPALSTMNEAAKKRWLATKGVRLLIIIQPINPKTVCVSQNTPSETPLLYCSHFVVNLVANDMQYSSCRVNFAWGQVDI